jgi:hypothetical protein
MKRVWLCVLLIVSMTGLIFAQSAKTQKTNPEKTTISGALGIAKGAIALKSGNDTYYVMGLNRFIGFIDGLKEGAQVTLEGYALTSPRNGEVKTFRVTKLTLNGKDYDLDTGNFAPRGNFNPPPPGWGWGPGPNNMPVPNRNGRSNGRR